MNPDWQIVETGRYQNGMITYTFEHVLRPFIRVMITVSSISKNPEAAAWDYLNETVE